MQGQLILEALSKRKDWWFDRGHILATLNAISQKPPPLGITGVPFDKWLEKTSYSIYFSVSPDKLTFMWRSTYLINKELPANVNRMLTNISKFPLWSWSPKLCSAHSDFTEFQPETLSRVLGRPHKDNLYLSLASHCQRLWNIRSESVYAARGWWDRSHNKDRVSWELRSWDRCCATRIYGTGASQSTLYWLN